ncbi:TonB-dependent receptor [Massilia sp. Dwa41.01b]|nr:TonB-dependent receptor [Massilia sp. Dwa41.01b]
MNGAPAAQRLQDYTAQVERLALFAQDEWEISPALQAYPGMRWEGVRTATEGRDLAQVSGSSGAASPILQLLWKLPEKRQLRLALARTYKAPLTRDLVPRRYTINNNNSAVNPDVEGNPALRPEVSWGLDLAWERYVGKDGVASVSAYARRVEDVTTQLLYRDGASWVSRPVNGGRARVAGIEFDIKSQAVLAGVPLELRLNAGRNWSWLDSVPGPDNRLGEQVGFTANAGIDYRGKLWSAGTSLAYQGSDASVSAAGVRGERGARALLDAYWLSTVGAGWRLRLSVANALGRDGRSASRYRDADGGTIRRAVTADGVATLRAALERNL